MRTFIVGFGICIYSLAASAQGGYCVESRGVPSSGAIEAFAALTSPVGGGGEALVAVSDELVIRSDDGGMSWWAVSSFDAGDELSHPDMFGEDDVDITRDASPVDRSPSIATFGDVVAVVRGSQLLLSHDGGLHFVLHRLPLSELAHDVTLFADGGQLLVAYGAAIAVIALSTEGLHLVADVEFQAEVAGLASREGELLIVSGLSATELLILADGLAFQPHRPPQQLTVEVRDMDVDNGGELWLLTTEGVSRWHEEERRPLTVASWPGLEEPAAIARGSGEAVYVVDDGELYVIDLGCRRDSATDSQPFTSPGRRRRRSARRIVRGLLPVVMVDFEAGQTALGVGIQLVWAWPVADPWEQQSWLELHLDEDEALRRLRVTRPSRLLSTSASWAGDYELEHAVRAMRDREERALLEALWP